jgi:hypothetical protein
MDRSVIRLSALAGAGAAVVAGLASWAGVLFRGSLATAPFTTFRGEAVEFVTDGVYRYNPEGLVAEGIGWDLVTACVVTPVTLLTMALLWRGSLRAALVAAGLLAYLAYQMFQYAVFWAYGPLYPLHVLGVALAISALALLFYGLDLERLRERVGGRFPHRPVLAYEILVTVLLLGLWLPLIGATLGGQVTDQLEGTSTFVVPAFDLGLLVPLGLFAVVTLWHRLAVGYLLGMVLLVKGTTMALAICAMLLAEWRVTDELALPPLIVFAVMAVLGLVLAARSTVAVGAGPSGAARRSHAHRDAHAPSHG